MAFYSDDDEDQLDPSAPQAPQTGAESGIISGQGSAPAAARAANAPDNPGNFVGIKQYLDANKPQAAKLGDQTAGVINNSANQARQSINDLNTAADAAIKPVQSLGSDILGKLNQAPETLNDDEKNKIKSTASAKYTGPKNETELGDAYTNAQKATQTAVGNIKNSGTEQGRMGLISQVNSKPRTQGMNEFDNALLQAGGGREKLASAAAANQDVPGSLDAATAAIRNKIGTPDDPSTPNINEATGAIGQTGAAQSDAYKSVQEALNNWKSAFTPKVQQAQNALVQQNQRVVSDIGDNPYNLDQETMDLLGLSNNQRVYGLDLNSYLQQGDPTGITAANVATPEDYARYAALADLAGDKSNLLDPNNIGSAGKMPGVRGDKDKLLADIKAAENSYGQSYGDDRNALANATRFGNWSFSTPAWAEDYIASVPPKQAALLGVPKDTQLRNATPQELEKFWIPLFRNPPANRTDQADWASRADELQRQVNDWKKSKGYDNVINPTMAQTPSMGK